MKYRTGLWFGCGWIFLAGVAAAAAAPFSEYNCRTGIVYKTVKGEALDLALFLPTVSRYEKAPVVLYTHGGGWSKLDKTVIFWPTFRPALDVLLANGIACAAIEYRLVRQDVSTAFDCVVDCKDAARFLVKHAEEYGLDPRRMGAWGGSAGGHLCLMTALAPDASFPGAPELQGWQPRFLCVVSYFPATTFLVPDVYEGSNFRNPGKFVAFLGGPYAERKDLAALLSPTEHLTPASPPVFLLHGDKDQVLSYKNATYMLDVAQRKGAPMTLLTVTNGLHGFVGENVRPSIPEINRRVAEFMIEKLTADLPVKAKNPQP